MLVPLLSQASSFVAVVVVLAVAVLELAAEASRPQSVHMRQSSHTEAAASAACVVVAAAVVNLHFAFLIQKHLPDFAGKMRKLLEFALLGPHQSEAHYTERHSVSEHLPGRADFQRWIQNQLQIHYRCQDRNCRIANSNRHHQLMCFLAAPSVHSPQVDPAQHLVGSPVEG